MFSDNNDGFYTDADNGVFVTDPVPVKQSSASCSGRRLLDPDTVR